MFRRVPSCSVMFRHVPSCSVMFRHVPSCSVMFRRVPSCSCQKRAKPVDISKQPNNRNKSTSKHLGNIGNLLGNSGCIVFNLSKCSSPYFPKIDNLGLDLGPSGFWILIILSQTQHFNKSQNWGFGFGV